MLFFSFQLCVCVFLRDRERQSEKSSLPFSSFFSLSLSPFHNLFCYSECVCVCVYSLAFSLSHTILFLLLLLLSTLDFEKKRWRMNQWNFLWKFVRMRRLSGSQPSCGAHGFHPILRRLEGHVTLAAFLQILDHQTLMIISLTNFFVSQIK